MCPRLDGVRVMRGDVRTAMQTSPGVAIEMLTSGTTGTPKRVPLSRESFDASFRGFTRYERRSEEHTSELQSLMRISYAVFCLKKKTTLKKCTSINKTKTPTQKT